MTRFEKLYVESPSQENLISIEKELRTSPTLLWEDLYWGAKCIYSYSDGIPDTDLLIDSLDTAHMRGLSGRTNPELYIDSLKILVSLYGGLQDYEKQLNYLYLLQSELEPAIPDWMQLDIFTAKIHTDLRLILRNVKPHLREFIGIKTDTAEIAGRKKQCFSDFLNQAADYVKCIGIKNVQVNELEQATLLLHLETSEAWENFVKTVLKDFPDFKKYLINHGAIRYIDSDAQHIQLNNMMPEAKNIPDIIENSLRGLFNVANLCQLPDSEKEEYSHVLSELYRRVEQQNYSHITRIYALNYIPLYLYKIWTPLYMLLLDNKLPRINHVLELGAGPGTATLGMISFYRQLAIENPYCDFELSFEIVEAEREFLKIFNTLCTAYIDLLPQNLKVTYHLNCADAFSVLQTYNIAEYDMVLESNMINPNEMIFQKNYISFSADLKRIVRPGGSVIMIEPAKRILHKQIEQIGELMQNDGFSITAHDEFAKIDFSKVKLVNEMIRAGIRYPGKTIHYYYYSVFMRQGE